jgi:hypothetical protein
MHEWPQWRTQTTRPRTLRKCASRGSGWIVKRISAFDTPAYTGEKVPDDLLPLLVSPEWVEERKIRWA